MLGDIYNDYGIPWAVERCREGTTWIQICLWLLNHDVSKMFFSSLWHKKFVIMETPDFSSFWHFGQFSENSSFWNPLRTFKNFFVIMAGHREDALHLSKYI